jgi:hypothetical protein
MDGDAIGDWDGLFLGRLRRQARGLDRRQKAYRLILYGGILYLALAALCSALIWDVGLDLSNGHTDLDHYRERAEVFLDGDIFNETVWFESAPLINWFFLLPQFTGGSAFAYSLTFGAFAILTSLAIFHFLSPLDEEDAYVAAVLFLLSPATLLVSAILVQDEAVVLFLFVVPLLLLATGRRGWSTVTATLGALSKVYSSLIIPLALLKDRGWKERGKHLALAVGVVLMVALPFAVANSDNLQDSIDFYGQKWEEHTPTGVSLWHFLYQAGLEVPNWVLQAGIVIGLLGVYYLAWRRDLDPLRAGFLIMLPFLLFYPKIHEPYYIFPVSIMCILGAKDELYYWLGGAIFLVALASSAFSLPADGGEAIVPADGAMVIVPVIMTLGIYAVLLYVAWRQVRMGPAPIIGGD